MDRRTFVKYFGGLTFLLSGCACPCKRPPLIEWTEPTGFAPLAPSRIQQKSIPLAFDVHSHLFNATDVHVRGYLAGPVAHSMNPALRNLVVAAAPLVEKIGQALAISCGAEMEQLASMLTRRRGFSELSAQADLRQEIDADVQKHLGLIEDELFRRMPGTDFARELDRADDYYQLKRHGLKSMSVPMTPLSQDKERIRAGLRQGEEPFPRVKPYSMEERAAESLNPLGVLRFIRYMVSPRHHSLRSFQKAYSEDDGAFGIDACFAALVDFDYWLGCAETPSSLRDQVLLHEQLAVLSGGYVLPLVPYNPWTDIERNDSSLELVRWAIEERGFVGVKIYPPMGFRPLGNGQPIDSSLPRPDGKKLDEKLRSFYAYCMKVGVPIMAHTGHSMGRDNAHDNLPNPDSWGAVFSEFPKLRVNAGHFGGDYHQGNEDWPKQFVDLMNNSAGSGLYVDLAYQEKLLDSASEQTARLKQLLAGKLQDGTPILSRVMYGSDWLMLSQINDWGAYAHGINNFVNSIPVANLNAMRRAVFFENTARCFGLNKEQPNRNRLEAFYSRWKMTMPLWMGQLDRA